MTSVPGAGRLLALVRKLDSNPVLQVGGEASHIRACKTTGYVEIVPFITGWHELSMHRSDLFRHRT